MRKEHIQLVDDLDGGPAQETIEFSVDGTDYEIDLSNDNAGKLRAILADYVANARRIKTPTPITTTRARKATTVRETIAQRKARNDAIRAWAAQQPDFAGMTFTRRIPNSVIDAYNHRNTKTNDNSNSGDGDGDSGNIATAQTPAPTRLAAQFSG